MKELLLGLSLFLCGTPSVYLDHEGASPRDEALDAARVWLVRHQDPETGLWSSRGGMAGCTCGIEGEAAYDAGVSGLALLALLGEPGSYEEEINAVVMGLSKLEKGGKFGRVSSHTYIYSHAVCVWALCEAMDRASVDSEECRKSVQAGVDILIAAECKSGGWRYDLRGTGEADSSVTTWCVLALAAARRVGFDVSDEHLFDGARVFRRYQEAKTGRIGYDDEGTMSSRMVGANENYPMDRAEALTAASLHALCAIGMASREDRRWGTSFALMEKTMPEWGDRFGTDMYYCMHGAAAFDYADAGGKSPWHKVLLGVVLPNQVEEEGCGEGSWEPSGPWCFAGGRVYSTAMMVLALDPLITPSIELGPLSNASVALEGEPGVGLLTLERRKAVRRSGKSKRIIKDGLDWLARHQSEMGSWTDKELALLCDPKDKAGGCTAYGAEASLGVTSMALLAFLGEGHHPGVDGPYRETVEHALGFLLEEFSPPEAGAKDESAGQYYFGLTERIFPVLALVEAAASIKDPKVEIAAKMGVESLLKLRRKDGGWSWGFGKAYDYDLREYYREEGACEPTAMALIALKRAERIGLIELPPEVLAEAVKMLDGLWMIDGSHAISTPNMHSPILVLSPSGFVLTRGDAPTAAAMLVERVATGEERELTDLCEERMLKLVPSKKNKDDGADLFAWFLTNLATHPNKKGLGKDMLRGVEAALDELQLSKGCVEGSWEDLCARNKVGSAGWGGRVYNVSAAILCLQTQLWGESLFGE